MLPQIVEFFLILLVFTFPAYILPLILGLVIKNRYREDELGRLAAYFTLKPLLATPLWFTVAGGMSALERTLPGLYRFLSLLPAIALTLLILWVCRRSLRANKGLLAILLIADAMRWINTQVYMSSHPGIPSLSDPYYMMGMILPNAFAVMALIIMYVRARKRREPALSGIASS